MISDRANSPTRVVTIGDESVGKTSLTARLVNNRFNQYEPSTVGANYQEYSVFVKDSSISIQIWDTAGQEKFKSLSPIYYRNASAAVVVFSLTSRRTFEKLNDWINSFMEVAGNGAIVYIAANKSDLTSEFEVTIEETREWAKSCGYKYFVTSAKTGEGVCDMFTELANDILSTKESKRQAVNPRPIQPNNESDQCC